MAIKLEKVTQTFYENLEQGKIMGRKCPKCGAVEFPPVYACNTCGSLETEWYEISGNAKLHSIVMPAPLSSKPEYKALGKFCYGEIELEEGSRNRAGRRIPFQRRRPRHDKEEEEAVPGRRKAAASGEGCDLSERRL